MNKVEQLIASLTKELESGIDSVISGKSELFEASNITPLMMEKLMKRKGFKFNHSDDVDWQVNGWQWDWWMTFTKGRQVFTAFGSGYYGKFEFRPFDS
jgi:hypothetical protein